MIRINAKKPQKKIWALASLSKTPNDAQKGLLFKLVIRSQFSYFPIV